MKYVSLRLGGPFAFPAAAALAWKKSSSYTPNNVSLRVRFVLPSSLTAERDQIRLFCNPILTTDMRSSVVQSQTEAIASDSEDEVFFGAVHQKEILQAQKLKKRRRNTLLVNSTLEAPLKRKVYAATVLQAAFRGFLARRKLDDNTVAVATAAARRNFAATTVQRRWRAILKRRAARKQQRLAAMKAERAARQRARAELAAAVTIQAAFRRSVAFRRYNAVRTATIVVQRWWRCTAAWRVKKSEEASAEALATERNDVVDDAAARRAAIRAAAEGLLRSDAVLSAVTPAVPAPSEVDEAQGPGRKLVPASSVGLSGVEAKREQLRLLRVKRQAMEQFVLTSPLSTALSAPHVSEDGWIERKDSSGLPVTPEGICDACKSHVAIQTLDFKINDKRCADTTTIGICNWGWKKGAAMWSLSATGTAGSSVFTVAADNGVLSETSAELRSGHSSSSDGSAVTIGRGGVIRLTAVGGKLSAWTTLTLKGDLGTETIAIHTSCSVPILIGDKYGSLEIVGFTTDSGIDCDLEGSHGSDPFLDVSSNNGDSGSALSYGFALPSELHMHVNGVYYFGHVSCSVPITIGDRWAETALGYLQVRNFKRTDGLTGDACYGGVVKDCAGAGYTTDVCSEEGRVDNDITVPPLPAQWCRSYCADFVANRGRSWAGDMCKLDNCALCDECSADATTTKDTSTTTTTTITTTTTTTTTTSTVMLTTSTVQQKATTAARPDNLNIGEACWFFGSTAEDRDESCAGALVCAKKGANGRHFGCDTHYCCAEENDPAVCTRACNFGQGECKSVLAGGATICAPRAKSSTCPIGYSFCREAPKMTTEIPTAGVSSCSDLAPSCTAWAAEGFCDPATAFGPYMKVNCEKTCGFCGPTARVTTATTTTTTADAQMPPMPSSPVPERPPAPPTEEDADCTSRDVCSVGQVKPRSLTLMYVGFSNRSFAQPDSVTRIPSWDPKMTEEVTISFPRFDIADVTDDVKTTIKLYEEVTFKKPLTAPFPGTFVVKLNNKKIKFMTNCRYALEVGNQFGPLVITGYTGNRNSGCHVSRDSLRQRRNADSSDSASAHNANVAGGLGSEVRGRERRTEELLGADEPLVSVIGEHGPSLLAGIVGIVVGVALLAAAATHRKRVRDSIAEPPEPAEPAAICATPPTSASKLRPVIQNGARSPKE